MTDATEESDTVRQGPLPYGQIIGWLVQVVTLLALGFFTYSHQAIEKRQTTSESAFKDAVATINQRMGAAEGILAARGERIAILEAKATATELRQSRIDDKLDKLMEFWRVERYPQEGS